MRLRSTMIACAMLALPELPAQAEVRYKLIELGNPGQNSVASGINNSGQVIFNGFGPAGPGAYLYSDGLTSKIDGIDGTSVTAFGINDRGYVTGYLGGGDGSIHTFLYGDGAMTDLGSAASFTNWGNAINNHNDIVGRYYDVDGPISDGDPAHAILFKDGSFTDLGIEGWYYNEAFDINDSGQIVSGGYNSIVYTDGVPEQIVPEFSGPSEAYGINELGDVTGYGGIIGEDFFRGAYLYRDGIFTDIGALVGGNFSAGLEVNDNADVVGLFNNPTGRRAFLYSKGAAYDLNDLIDPSLGWTLSTARDINNSGMIVGDGIKSGIARAFLLIPLSSGVPEPASWAMMIGGLGLVGASFRRGRKVSVTFAQ